MKKETDDKEFCPVPICRDQVIKKSKEAKQLYEELCRGILCNHLEKPSEREINLFLQDDHIVLFFEFISNHLYYLWQNQKAGIDTVVSSSCTTNSKEELPSIELIPDKASSEDKVNSVEDNAEVVETDSTVPISQETISLKKVITAPSKSKDHILENNDDTDESNNHEAIITSDTSIDMNKKQLRTGIVSQEPNNLLPISAPNQPKVIFKLANATIKKGYSAKLENDCSVDIKVIKLNGLDDTGLTYSNTTGLVSGMPAQPGEYELSVMYQLSNQGGSYEAIMDFVVNHDPRSLWKNKPSDEALLFWKKDEDSVEHGGYDGWSMVAASKRGRSHAHEGKCRDDDFSLISDNSEGWHVLAVADGAGSSKYSREAAKLVVQKASTLLSVNLEEENEKIVNSVLEWEEEKTEKSHNSLRNLLYSTAFRSTIYETIKALFDTAKENECDFRDLHSTLLLAAHKKINGKHFVAGYWIGDGGLVMYGEGTYVSLLGDGDSGDYAGQTRFLDREASDGNDITSRIHFDCRETMTALFLMTDGITDPIFETDHNLSNQKYWDAFWQETIHNNISKEPSQTEKNLLDWLDFWSVGNHDDRTLAFLYKRNEP